MTTIKYNIEDDRRKVTVEVTAITVGEAVRAMQGIFPGFAQPRPIMCSSAKIPLELTVVEPGVQWWGTGL